MFQIKQLTFYLLVILLLPFIRKLELGASQDKVTTFLL